MSEQENNVCEICGGVKRVDWTISFVDCHPVEVRFDPASLAENWRLCPGHPEPTPTHDGNLDEDSEAYWHAEVCHYPYQTEEPRIHISGGYEFEMMLLNPKQALSLLAWLKQEEAELQRLAKG